MHTTDRQTLAPYVIRYVGDRMRRGEIQPITAKNVRNHLLDFSESFGARPTTQLGTAAIDRWLEATTHLAPATRSARLSSLRLFSGWLVDNEVIARDFTRRAPKIRRPRTTWRGVTLDEFVAILEACAGEREAAVVWLQWGLGLRCVEVARLRLEDWNTHAHTLIATGKGRHERELAVPPIVRAALTSYLATLPATAAGPVIRSELDPTRGLSASRVSNMVSRIISRAGVKRRPYDGISAHGMRRGAATELLEVCNDLTIVQRFLGHANLATTSGYLRPAGLSKMRDALNARPYPWEAA